ncbi:MFS transporter [Geobacter sp. SVR]|uniref:MFS transporter n=1 Tax=Geobacter sp. SVR TaxID=2495594 RepID=UPI00143EF800|nr:MFS transporter [Geobacter sp. SVR]BCS52564.1 putative MFS-type transporter YybF [Geobacter sp. SVR]GCF83998.1 putative MFS-type transporter YybF [Geobacter sp. SVR]
MTGAAQGLPHSAGIRIGTPAYRRVNLALFCAGFVTFVTLYDVQPLLPLFAREFNVVPAVASLPLSIATAALALGMLLAGTVSDSFGRRQLMTLALVLTSLLALATYFSHSFQSLLALRLVQGLVLAGVPSVAMAYLGEEMDAHSISSAMGLYISGNAVGGMTGRIGSAILCDHLPWQTAIAVIGIISLGLSLLFLRSLPPSANFHHRPFQLGYLFSSLYRQLRDPGLLCLYGLAFLCMGGFVSLYNYIGFRLLDAPYSLSQSSVSLIFLVYLLGSFSSGIVGSLINRFGRPFMIRVTLLVMLAGTLVTLASSLPLIVFGVGIFTCGFFSAHAIASSWVGRRARTGKAQASSLYLFCYYQGSSISGTLGGMFWQHLGWPGVACMIALLVVAAFGVATVLLRLPAAE